MDREVKIRFFEPFVIAEELNYKFIPGIVRYDQSEKENILLIKDPIYINGDFNNAFIIKPKHREDALFNDSRSDSVVVSCIPMKQPEVWESRMYLIANMWVV